MQNQTTYFRIVAIPACVIWGLLEFFALQRARFHIRHTQ